MQQTVASHMGQEVSLSVTSPALLQLPGRVKLNKCLLKLFFWVKMIKPNKLNVKELANEDD